MGKKTWLTVLLALSLVSPLCVATQSSAAPSLIGNWSATVPKITLSGCSNESISLTITAQCTNLFSGSMLIGATSINVVGKYSPADNTLQVQGEYQNPSTYAVYMVTLVGTYVAGTPPSVSVSSFSYTTSDLNSMNTEYDSFSLTKF
jgi:hypothetical protein